VKKKKFGIKILILKKINDRKMETLRIKLHLCAQNLPWGLFYCSLSNAFLIYVFSPNYKYWNVKKNKVWYWNVNLKKKQGSNG
jgi:hypothetical protein